MFDRRTLRILDGLAESVFIVNGRRQVLYANPAAVRTFGRDAAGRDLVVAIRHPECLDAVNAVLAGAEESHITISTETPMRASFAISVLRLESADPEGPRASISLNDISHIREAEQMRSDFVANVSHELRSPLTTLAGFIETLRGPAKGDDEAQERFLGLMAGEAERMKRLIQDLLSLSRVEANQRIRPRDRVDLSAIARRVVTSLANMARAENRSIHLESPDRLPAITGNEDELVQVFHNLIENAVKYGAPGTEVTIRLSLIDHAPGIGGRALALAVSDRGMGIPPEHLPRLTERFYRVDAGRSRDKGGTGLGLAIVKHIVRRHRGRLHIESQPGKGSTFTIHLPAESAVEPD